MPPREPFDTPEREKEHPEPSMFGLPPAYGFFIRHASGVELNIVEVGFEAEDRRPAFVREEVRGIEFRHGKAQQAEGAPAFLLKNVEKFNLHGSAPVADTKIARVERKQM